MYGIPDSKTPRLSFYEFGKLPFLPTVILMPEFKSRNPMEKAVCMVGDGPLKWVDWYYEIWNFSTVLTKKKTVYSSQLTFCLDCTLFIQYWQNIICIFLSIMFK